MKPVLLLKYTLIFICSSFFMACIASTVTKPSSQIIEDSIGKNGKSSKMNNPNQNINAKQSDLDNFKEPSKKMSDSSNAEIDNFEIANEIQDVYFEFDQFTLTENAKNTLRKTSAWMKKNPSIKAKLEGHCDVRGTNNYNISLGNKRAESVKEVLVALGVVGKRLLTVSYGEEKPICFENMESCWKKNRRVHFMISSQN